jgi:tRNA(adenine34) deaminase
MANRPVAPADNSPDAGQPTELDRSMMQRALVLASKAAVMGEVPVGAVIYRGEQVLAEAHNLRESQRDPTAHAEMIAMREAAKAMASWRIEDCTLAVTLEPCPMCAGALVNARVPRLVYGALDPNMGAVDSLYNVCNDPRLNHRLEVVAGVEADQCAAVLQAFFRLRRTPDPPAKPGSTP